MATAVAEMDDKPMRDMGAAAQQRPTERSPTESTPGLRKARHRTELTNRHRTELTNRHRTELTNRHRTALTNRYRTDDIVKT